MRVVVVGAGAVGRVYGRHLQAGGAEVIFRVRRPEAVRRPFLIYPLNDGDPVRYDAPVVGTDAEVAAFRPDYAVLAVPSDALRGEWLAPFLAACGDATVVALQPGVEEASVIHAAKADVKLARGVITLIAYQAPLPGETRFAEPGVAVWVPPMVAAPLAGPGVAPLAEVLRRGRMRVRVAGDLARESAYGALVFAVNVTALNAVGWSFAALKTSDVSEVAALALREATAITERRTGLRPPWFVRLLRPWVVRSLLALGERTLPLPLETYVRVHFTKVEPQTRMHLALAVEHGRTTGQPTTAIETLLARTTHP